MTYAAKRNSTGHYTYRGYDIENVKPYGGAGWNVTAPGEDSAHDTAETLQDAKAIVDRYEARN